MKNNKKKFKINQLSQTYKIKILYHNLIKTFNNKK